MLIDDDELEALGDREQPHHRDRQLCAGRAKSTSASYDSAYYIVPNDKVGQDAFAVIRDAMKGKDMVALGRVVMAKRERVIALEAAWKRPYGHDAALSLRGAQRVGIF